MSDDAKSIMDYRGSNLKVYKTEDRKCVLGTEAMKGYSLIISKLLFFMIPRRRQADLVKTEILLDGALINLDPS